jgi:hypothetical protein
MVTREVIKMNKRRLLVTLARIPEDKLTESEKDLLRFLKKDKDMKDNMKEDLEYAEFVEEERLDEKVEEVYTQDKFKIPVGPSDKNPFI